MHEGIELTQNAASVSQEFQLPVDQVERLSDLAAARGMSESQVLERALDIFFGLADVFDDDLERSSWYRLSEPSLSRVWGNDQDALTDRREELYPVLGCARKQRTKHE